jgi:hypothetical protein
MAVGGRVSVGKDAQHQSGASGELVHHLVGFVPTVVREPETLAVELLCTGGLRDREHDRDATL